MTQRVTKPRQYAVAFQSYRDLIAQLQFTDCSVRTQGVPVKLTGQLSIAFLLSVYEYEESAEKWLDGVP